MEQKEIPTLGGHSLLQEGQVLRPDLADTIIEMDSKVALGTLRSHAHVPIYIPTETE